jgi:hypothetical protein
MGPTNSLAEEFAATAGKHHRQPLHADIPPMLNSNAHLVLLW